MIMRNARRIKRWVFAVCALAASAGAQSDPLVDASSVLHFLVRSDVGVAEFSVRIEEFTRNAQAHTYRWEVDGAIDLRDKVNGRIVATLNWLTIVVEQWSQFDLVFSADAGEAETEFVIRMGRLTFEPLDASVALGRARARFNVMDRDGNGASVRALGKTGAGAFVARYRAVTGQDRLFSQLVGTVVCGPGGSGYGEQRDPITGYRVVGDGAAGMDATCAFRLSANDRATVTTSYDLNPNPRPCLADLTGDGFVGITDLLVMLQNFGRTHATLPDGDTDGDDDVDVADLINLMNDYGRRCP